MSSSAEASTSTTTSVRPRTHRPRGICRYYNAPRGCFAGDKCKFLHGEPTLGPEPSPEASSSAQSSSPPLLTPYDTAKVCRHYVNGFCKRGDTCWFKHVLPASSPLSTGKEKEADNDDSDSEAALCSICFDPPVTYGLLEGCNHVFCINCIRQWRDVKAKPADVVVSAGNNKKKCPMCRTSSNFITPSSIFAKHGTAEKETIIRNYKESMSKVPCRYFQKTRNREPMCPFGKDCFYRHEKADGTLHVFKEGAAYWMRRYENRSGRGNGLDTEPLFMFGGSLGGRLFRLPFDFHDPLFLDTVNNLGLGGSNATNGGAAGQEDENITFSWGFEGVANESRLRTAVRELRATAAHTRPPRRQASDSNNNGPAIAERTRRLGSNLRRIQTVQDIGRSLEALTNAMDEGSTLERIGETVQNLQDNLRRGSAESLATTESMQRLQSLTEQMLASIALLQNSNVNSLNTPAPEDTPPGAATPQPPSDPVPGEARTILGALTQTLGEFQARTENAEVDEDEDDEDDDDDDRSSMPDLQSISNSSEDDYSDDDVGMSDDGSDFDYDLRDFGEVQGTLEDDSPLRFFQRLNRNGPATNAGAATAATPAPPAGQESTDTGGGDLSDLIAAFNAFHRSGLSAQEEEEDADADVDADDNELPDLVEINFSSDDDDDDNDLDDHTPRGAAATSPPPPFVTDGRGRVVWTTTTGANQPQVVVQDSGATTPLGPAQTPSDSTFVSTSDTVPPPSSSSQCPTLVAPTPVLPAPPPPKTVAPAPLGEGPAGTGEGSVVAQGTSPSTAVQANSAQGSSGGQ